MRSNPEHIKILLEHIQRKIAKGGIANYQKSIEDMKRHKPKINDTRRFKLEDDDFIPFMGGRPKRDNPINKDDIVDLVIAMHKCRTLSEFLERV